MDACKVKELVSQEEELSQYKGEDEVISSHQARELSDARKKHHQSKIYSNLQRLDEITDGFRPGELVVLSGPTSHGKTSFACTLTNAYEALNSNTLWFSFEQPIGEFIEKFTKLPLFYVPKNLKDTSIGWIERRIIESKVKYNTEVVFVDHLHYLVSMSDMSKGNASFVIGAIMRELKKIAVLHNVLIVLLAHIQKIEFDKKPDLSHLRDSSFVGQEADFVLMIWRLLEKGSTVENKIYSDKSQLAVYKNRRSGKTGFIYLDYKDNMFTESEIQH
jgi:replicative DNA helicase